MDMKPTMDYEEGLKRIEKIKRVEARRDKAKKDASNVTKWLYFISLSHAFFILIPIFGDSWIAAQFNGFGVSMVTLRTSLFMIDVKVDCEKNFFEDKICARLKKFEGRHTLNRARDTFCAIPGSGSACTMVQQTSKSSFIIFVFFTVSAGFHMFSSAFLYYYWEKTPLPQARRFAHLFFFLGPISSVLGLIMWTICTPNLSELARSWTSTADAVTAGLPIFSFQAVGDNPYGWCWFYSVVLCVISLLTMMVWPAFFVEHEKEDLAKEEELRAMDTTQNYGFFGMDHDYGSMSSAQPGASYYNSAHLPYGGSSYADTMYGSSEIPGGHSSFVQQQGGGQTSFVQQQGGQSSFAHQQNQFHFNP